MCYSIRRPHGPPPSLSSYIIHTNYLICNAYLLSDRRARGLIRLLVLIFSLFASFFSFSLYVLFLLFLTILHDPACPLLHHTLHTPHLDLSSYTNHIFKSLVLFFLFHVHQDIISQFCCYLPLNLNLFLPYVHCSCPACPLIAQLISLLHFQTIFSPLVSLLLAHFPHDMMSIVVITSSSNRQDQTLSPSIALFPRFASICFDSQARDANVTFVYTLCSHPCFVLFPLYL